MKMSRRMYSRHEFVKKNSLAGLGAAVAISSAPTLLTGSTASVPALLGGEPVRTKPWPAWPMWIPEKDEALLLKSIRSGVWSRAGLVTEFENKWAQAIGTKRCLAVVNGTNAISAALINLGIGGGDEVIVPPYTFIATVVAVIQSGAMPVFADTDQRTFQIDTEKIEAKITPRTKAIVPVHILGLPANMPRVLEIAKKHNLLVVEDACQAWLAEINHKKVGSFGNAGAFSFQNSKNMPIGEGGAITSDDDAFMDRCYSYHNYGNPYGTSAGTMSAGTIIPGTKLRMAEYQAAIGLAQFARLEEQTTNRNENALYLQGKLRKISGIIPYELNKGVTRAAYHLFPFRYKKEQFKGMTRDKFLAALKAEGVPGSSGYTPLNKMPYLEAMMKQKNFQKMYPADMLDYKKYLSQNQCPANDQLCEEAVWFSQNMLLGTKADMDDIVNAIVKVKENAGKLG